jgi:pimeloyl-ACP methyl ester carboxylesterase
MRYALLLLLLLLCVPAGAETVETDGPAGPLQAEAITVEGAENIVVIIPGSGPIDRDGNSPQTGLSTDTYQLLATGLEEEEIASLRIDKRGFFGSQNAISDPNDVTIAAYAQDVRGWIERASEMAPCVWLAGHSEGGLVALVAAEDAPGALCGLVLLSTAGRPVGQLLLEQMRLNPANAPLMEDIERMVESLERGETRDPKTLPQPLQPLFTLGLQRYMTDLFSYDPVPIANRWQGLALII